MSRKIIRIGTSANDGTGDTLRETANKINFNFAELYTALGLDGCGNYSLNIAPPSGNDISLTTLGLGAVSVNSAQDVTITSGQNSTISLTGKTVFNSAVQLPRMTTEERNNIATSNGIVVYNTTENKFQGYANGSWVNLH